MASNTSSEDEDMFLTQSTFCSTTPMFEDTFLELDKAGNHFINSILVFCCNHERLEILNVNCGSFFERCRRSKSAGTRRKAL